MTHAGSAQIPSYNFPNDSQFARDVRSSVAVANRITDTITFHESEVASYFSANPSLTYPHTFAPWPLAANPYGGLAGRV